jgi:ribosome-binding protein aMBF1 (putative translation factor)
MARVKAGLRQYELAQLLGVPATIICDLERGRRPVTDEWERRIREVLAKRDSMDGNDAKHGHSNPEALDEL